MAGVAECPSCGETEELRGEPHEGDIRVTCLSCGAAWMRGAPRCAGCGGMDIVERPQAMTRHSRGTQLSIIGWRQLPLCRVCDADALHTSIEENIPVPGDYVPACLHGHGERAAAPPSPPAPAPKAPESRENTPEPRQAARTAAPSPASAEKPAPAAGPPEHPRRKPATSPARPRTGPAPSAVPTVRQAIGAFLAEASGGVDHTAMLLLGTHLGSYNRLEVLDRPDAADTLAAWCDGHWESRGDPAAQRALDTIRRAVDFWGARGWLTSDPAAHLR
ncbi:hypothetical protein [Streptomyces sp. MNU89]|uniref:hypothetical protein n=1 Tax=Streptomyces sp. MNU89 TaxID=2560025 RepID=UPI001E46BE0A|nr:hypothetical protein [Streptomyces sp. MNU89]MCC9738467.1 hypothetical protein [Streptomyces sp. MNU89]